ncbi:Plexin domain-containing protein 2,Plexin domain-containing protein 1 [Lepeophtheirus salmonis]|uniref:Plexin domain-containing protein 2,Plexin domain-containing protein 1 n=1 Tax=Lepeophtheirus salmonis TaxID=72036 RepID=A0A7R8CGG2_LEPSM|nr:Plexin domain-containing protein 2,Plexin domain-containing protein 1 [Lepeophtheirus salmonis]CAF2816041.1 Plexin domain-containing protein 2,Plexin domain-containing protein 1 [Lepeophtheirus salmonis]
MVWLSWVLSCGLVGTGAEEDESYDHHKYYKSLVRQSEDFWVDLTHLNKTEVGLVRENAALADSYRQAATVKLSFQFPFYGHYMRNLTIATGGFLFTGDEVHSWLAATHYIAPLMANFDLRKEGAKIIYADNGTAFIVEWNNVYLNDVSNSSISGPFSFQTIIHHNGDIIFAYKTIALNISLIEDKFHPVKVGLSDAYTIDKSAFYARRITIYEYHYVNLRDSSITNSSAILFKSLPTCNVQSNCEKCILFNGINQAQNDVNFKCAWCPKLQSCSDGVDRYLQKWLNSHLQQVNIKDISTKAYNSTEFDGHVNSSSSFNGKTDISSIARFNIVIVIILCVLLLIKYRPTKWQWRRNHPRYTAASIHMVSTNTDLRICRAQSNKDVCSILECYHDHTRTLEKNMDITNNSDESLTFFL